MQSELARVAASATHAEENSVLQHQLAESAASDAAALRQELEGRADLVKQQGDADREAMEACHAQALEDAQAQWDDEHEIAMEACRKSSQDELERFAAHAGDERQGIVTTAAQELDASKAALEEELTRQLAGAEQRHGEACAVVEKKAANAAESARRDHDSAIERLKTHHASMLATVKADVESHATSLHGDHVRELEAAAGSHADALGALESTLGRKHDNDVARALTVAATERASAVEAREEELRQSHVDAVDALRSELVAEHRAIAAQQREELARAARGDADTARQEHEGALRELQQENVGTLEQHAAAMAASEAARKDLLDGAVAHREELLDGAAASQDEAARRHLLTLRSARLRGIIVTAYGQGLRGALCTWRIAASRASEMDTFLSARVEAEGAERKRCEEAESFRADAEARLESGREAAASELKQQRAVLEAAHADAVGARTLLSSEETDSLREAHATAVRQLKEEHAATVAELDASASSALKALAARGSTALADAQANALAEASALHEEHCQFIDSAEEFHTKSMDDIRRRNKEEREKLKARAETDKLVSVRKATKKAGAAMAALRTKHEEDMAEVQQLIGARPLETGPTSGEAVKSEAAAARKMKAMKAEHVQYMKGHRSQLKLLQLKLEKTEADAAEALETAQGEWHKKEHKLTSRLRKLEGAVLKHDLADSSARGAGSGSGGGSGGGSRGKTKPDERPKPKPFVSTTRSRASAKSVFSKPSGLAKGTWGGHAAHSQGGGDMAPHTPRVGEEGEAVGTAMVDDSDIGSGSRVDPGMSMSRIARATVRVSAGKPPTPLPSPSPSKRPARKAPTTPSMLNPSSARKAPPIPGVWRPSGRARRFTATSRPEEKLNTPLAIKDELEDWHHEPPPEMPAEHLASIRTGVRLRLSVTSRGDSVASLYDEE